MKKTAIVLIVLLKFVGSSCPASAAEAAAFVPQRPYVVTFTFQGGFTFQANLMLKEQLDVFNDGGFDGWGGMYVRGTHLERGKTIEDLPAELAFLKSAALEGKNIFEQLMSTTRYCSLGQITSALFDVGGQYRRNM